MNLYETQYPGIYVTEDGIMVNDEGYVLDENGDAVDQIDISDIQDEADGAIDLYETEYDGVYATDEGYFVTDDGDVYDEDGDLIEEGAVEVFTEGSKKKKAAAAAAVAGGMIAAGAAKGVYDSMKRPIGAMKKYGKNIVTKRGWMTADGKDVTARGQRMAQANIKHPKLMDKIGSKYDDKYAEKNFNRMRRYGKRMKSGALRGAAKGAAAAAATGAVLYGAKKAYDHFKKKDRAKNESGMVINDYEGLA